MISDRETVVALTGIGLVIVGVWALFGWPVAAIIGGGGLFLTALKN